MRLLRKLVWHDSWRDQHERPLSAPCISVAPNRLRRRPRPTLAGRQVGVSTYVPGPARATATSVLSTRRRTCGQDAADRNMIASCLPARFCRRRTF